MTKEVEKIFLWVGNLMLSCFIIALPMIALKIEYEIVGLILMIVDGILVNVYGTLYFKLN